jgi:two-component system sensor histidine kinase BasS
VTTAINQLVSLNLTLDRERLFTADVAHELRRRWPGCVCTWSCWRKCMLGRRPADPASRSDDQQHYPAAAAGARRAVISAGSYQQVLLLEDVVMPLQVSWRPCCTAPAALQLPEMTEDIVVSGDATLLRVLLRNLVENAHRYSPAGRRLKCRYRGPDAGVWRWKMKGRELMRRKAAS